MAPENVPVIPKITVRYIYSQLQLQKTEEVPLGSNKDCDQSQWVGGAGDVTRRRLGVEFRETEHFCGMQTNRETMRQKLLVMLLVCSCSEGATARIQRAQHEEQCGTEFSHWLHYNSSFCHFSTALQLSALTPCWVWSLGSTIWPASTDLRVLLRSYHISFSFLYSGPKTIKWLVCTKHRKLPVWQEVWGDSNAVHQWKLSSCDQTELIIAPPPFPSKIRIGPGLLSFEQSN